MNHRLLALATLTVALAACSTVPDRNSALEQARGRFLAAQRDPQVARLAPDELKRASEALGRADRARIDGAATSVVDHLAYVAGQRVVIAQETAWSHAAQAVTAGASSERDRMRLEARTQEVDAAQRDLAVAEQSNARKTSELAAADAGARRDQARVERRDARVSDLETQLKDLNAKKTERGLVVTLGDVLFDSGQSRLLPGSAPNMEKLAAVFRRNPGRTASIEGYTDSVGGSAANQELSQRRAHTVRGALVYLGVPAERLTARGHGADDPAASNSTAAGRQMNRRVEIVFAPLADDLSSR